MPTPLVHRTSRRISLGSYFPLGATPRRGGVNFALFSRDAREVWLILFDTAAGEPTDVIRLERRTRYVWHVFVHGVGAGQLYGYRVVGEHNPAHGFRFNPHKLLIDPYAKALTGKVVNRDNLLLAYEPMNGGRDLSLDTRSNAAVVPKAVVVDDDAFDWQGDAPPGLSLERLIIYEVHLKGFTAHPSSGVAHPGTYLGFIEKIPHLKSIGVNAVELLPIHEFCIEDALQERGLTNYWGYNTIGFFAPESSYAATPGAQVTEFKTLVRALHRAGIEVILDVVYNHTAEGSELGPTLSFRGIDNRTYYVLTGPPDQPRRHSMNWTGTGNSFNLSDPAVIRLVLDSMRYWVETMHVDGFRFDLASVLGREDDGTFRASSSFFDAVSQDPVLQRAKLIAEPWDIGTYQVGNFPPDWSEWNGRFRDTLRKFLKGDGGQLQDLGTRFTGSRDLYGDDGRAAFNSINFITCHDGFTLNDLVSYDRKHNEVNQEGNRDGTDDNNSWNGGAEGETADPVVRRLRRQLVKNHLCALLYACGTPMVLGGDEFGRTQRGNNNAYCQDNALSWFDWTCVERNADVLAFFRKAVAFLDRCPILLRRRFLTGEDRDRNGVPDILWLGADLGAPRWTDSGERTLAWQIDGAEEPSELGEYRVVLIFNAHWEAREIRLPPLPGSLRWRRVADTSLPSGEDFLEEGHEVPLDPPNRYIASGRSTVVLVGRPGG